MLSIPRVKLFADDDFPMVTSNEMQHLLDNLKTKVELMIKWLTQSGLKVNGEKTELCIFARTDIAPITIIINNTQIKSKPSMNVLGVQFDSKLTWEEHVNNTINKSKKALHAIRLIKKYFNKQELLNLLTSNFYSILYYSWEIWQS